MKIIICPPLLKERFFSQKRDPYFDHIWRLLGNHPYIELFISYRQYENFYKSIRAERGVEIADTVISALTKSVQVFPDIPDLEPRIRMRATEIIKNVVSRSGRVTSDIAIVIACAEFWGIDIILTQTPEEFRFLNLQSIELSYMQENSLTDSPDKLSLAVGNLESLSKLVDDFQKQVTISNWIENKFDSNWIPFDEISPSLSTVEFEAGGIRRSVIKRGYFIRIGLEECDRIILVISCLSYSSDKVHITGGIYHVDGKTFPREGLNLSIIADNGTEVLREYIQHLSRSFVFELVGFPGNSFTLQFLLKDESLPLKFIL
ncbi:MAG: hypothetical protein WBA57_20985 [Elainellaceae cyanobacterium]